MRDNWLLAATLVLLGGLALPGCAAPTRSITISPMAESHIIFNPYWNTPVVAGTDRAQWPVVLVTDETNPEVRFRETITDYQGLSARGRDYYYRRIDSTRTRDTGR